MQTLQNKIASIKAAIKKAEGNISKNETERLAKLDYIRITEKQIHDKYDNIKKTYELKVQMEKQKLAVYEKMLEVKQGDSASTVSDVVYEE